MQSDKLSCVDVERDLNGTLELSESFDFVQTPAGFRPHVRLYHHQAIIVRALCDIENKRVLTVNTTKYADRTVEDVKIETSAVVLSEPLGSGKTIEILAMILIQPVPRAFPVHVNDISSIHTFKSSDRIMFNHEILKVFTGPNALIRPNLIVVNSSVLVQWETAIRDFTTLKFYSISDYYKLCSFYRLYRENKAKGYDIVLLKNGKVTGNFRLVDEPAVETECRSLITVVAKMTASSCWSRVIYDDFDTISSSADCLGFSSLFTVYVSATNKTIYVPRRTCTIYRSITEALRDRGEPLALVHKDTKLFTNFNVRCTAECVEMSTSVPIVNGYEYLCSNRNDTYIRLLGVMEGHAACEIIEMLNGDAIATAADAMGIKTHSVADIFQKLLDKKYKKFVRSKRTLELVERVQAAIPALESNGEHTGAELAAIKRSICKGIMPALEYYSSGLGALIDDLHTTLSVEKEQHGEALNRVVGNIKEGECQVCRLPLEGSDVFIIKCCGLIVCDICGIKGNQMTARYTGDDGTMLFTGSCANCRASINLAVDFIFVDKDFNIESALGAAMKASAGEIVGTVHEETVPTAEIENPKLRALMAIIRGEEPENRKPIQTNIPSLLQGIVDRPAPPGQATKVLVFASFNETLVLIENFFREYEIEYTRLGGTYRENAKTVAEFREHGQVLLINSQQHCAGLNLHFCTDLVYFHRIIDPNVESQVAGRIQRIGRTCNAKIHYLAYANEARR
jgi:hypothetical protein